MIRVVNLMFGLQNDGECRRRRRSWYELDALHLIYNLGKICKPDGRHPVQFFNLVFELFK